MAEDLDEIKSIKTLAIAALKTAMTAPKPDYSIDGQSVSWTAYVAMLREQTAWCDQQIASNEPFEFITEGHT
jgi:hypothetical protein